MSYTTQNDLLLTNLMKYYEDQSNLEQMLGIITGDSKISLRIVDWFVTNYAKAHNTSYTVLGQEFVVYMNYKNQLKAYSKKLFDPFCRRERISFQVPGHEAFLTTVGKLNFFRWAIEKDILTFIKGHQTEIEREMNTTMRELAKQAKVGTKSEAGTRKRTTRDMNTPGTNIQKHECEIEMRFD